MEYTIEEIKLLYRRSPAKVYVKSKVSDRLFVNDDDLYELLGILSICKISYCLKTGMIAERNVNEIIMNQG